MRMPWGKHRGECIEDIPSSYLCWVLDDSNASNAIKEAVARELGVRYGHEIEVEVPRTVYVHGPLRSRLSADTATWAIRIVESGFRALAKLHHPDVGGKGEDMRRVIEVTELLRKELE